MTVPVERIDARSVGQATFEVVFQLIDESQHKPAFFVTGRPLQNSLEEESLASARARHD
jgi:hypothetical protein